MALLKKYPDFSGAWIFRQALKAICPVIAYIPCQEYEFPTFF
jgi:hypothetical protein